MRRLAIAFAAAFAVLAFAAPAVAGDAGATYTQEQVVTFGEAAVAGEILRPEYERVTERRRAEFESLIRLRSNFYPELSVSTDDL